MKNNVGSGDILTVTAPAALTSGQAFILGSLFLVAVSAAASGEEVAAVRTGVHKLPKESTDDMAVGEKLNWDDTGKHLQEGTADLDNVATVVKAAGNGVTEVECVLTPV